MRFTLAPIAGFSNAAFRLMAARGGADMTYTEMVSAAGLAHGSSPTRHLLEVLPGEGPVACQLFGSKPDELAYAAREVSSLGRFVELDLNAGCPVPRIIHEGSGAALVKNPALVHDLISAMVAETDLPVTLKTRPGPRPDKVMMLELLDAAETAGAKGITLHGRFTSQSHAGDVHLDLIAELVRAAKIPVTGNGGVKDAETARAMAETGVSAIMVGRAALPDPYIFSALKNCEVERFSSGVSSMPGTASSVPDGTGRIAQPLRSTPQRLNASTLFLEHLDALKALHSQIAAAFPGDRLPTLDSWTVIAVRTHLFRYFSGMPGAAQFRRRMVSASTIADIMASADPRLFGEQP